MIKALIFTDLQASEGPERCHNDRTLPLQRYRVKKFLSEARHIYEDNACTALWNLGDTTDDRNSIPIPTIDTLLTGLGKFPASPHNYALIGNHDQFLRNTELHMGRLIESVFNIVAKPQAIEIEGAVVIFAPYPASEPKLAEELDSLLLKHRRKPIIIIGHFGVKGCRMKSGTALAGVSVELLDRANLTLLGHIHLPQRLGQNIFYVGSPFQQDFGEANEEKRVAILTIDNGEFNLEFVPIDGFPKYKAIDLATFKSEVAHESEDRFQVVLRTTAESEEFYAHPLSSRAQPIYAYGESETVEQAPVSKDWSIDAALKTWADKNKLADRGIELTVEELVAFGKQIAAG